MGFGENPRWDQNNNLTTQHQHQLLLSSCELSSSQLPTSKPSQLMDISGYDVNELGSLLFTLGVIHSQMMEVGSHGGDRVETECTF